MKRSIGLAALLSLVLLPAVPSFAASAKATAHHAMHCQVNGKLVQAKDQSACEAMNGKWVQKQSHATSTTASSKKKK